MFEYLKVKNYKGITSELELEELGHINVLCGKNNSGKTSILEAIGIEWNNSKNFAIGRKFHKDELVEQFNQQVEEKGTNIGENKRWFAQYCNENIERKTILYTDTVDNHINDIKEYQRAHSHFVISFNFKAILDKFFADLIFRFKPMLIIPRRSIIYYTPVTISKSQYYSNDGKYIANLLFYLKSQNPGSPEVEKYERISRAFEQITGCSFSISFSKVNENEILLSFNIPNDVKSWVPGDFSGLGLSDILILITFIIASDATLMLIEEPENHLHPEMQRKFLNFIRTVDAKQFILSTHSNIFLDPYVVDKIFYVEFDDGVKVTDETSKSEMLYNLGYSVSDNLVSDMVLLTEGPTDIPILRTIFDWIGLEDKYNIRFWPLGGDMMPHLDLSVFNERNNVFALIDSDPKSRKNRDKFRDNCDKYRIPCYKLERYAIENYFTIEAVRRVFPNIPGNISKLKPNKKVEKQLEINIKNNNSKIIKSMSLDDIIHTDLYTFCMKFKENLETNS